MNCPKCGAESKVIDTRGGRRRRECVSCSTRYSTVEVMAGDARKYSKPRNLEPKQVVKLIEKPAVKQVVKPVQPVSAIKKAAEARRKLEYMRDSFLDPDYDFIPERW